MENIDYSKCKNIVAETDPVKGRTNFTTVVKYL